MNTSKAKEQYQQMRQALGSWVNLSDVQWRQLAGIFKSKTVNNRDQK